MQFKRKALIVIFIFLFSLVACSNNESRYSSSKQSASDNAKANSSPIEKQGATKSNDIIGKNKTQKIPNPSARMVIYNADLQLEVKNLKNVQTKINQFAREFGGYIVDQTISNNQDERISGTLTIRIPQENFQTFISNVEKLGINVNQRNITGQDVTEEYVDLDSRLKSKQIVEKRLIQFMNQAKDTKDLLEISNQLASVQEEIETITGKMKYLENQTNLSTVTIQMFENKVIIPKIENDQLNTFEKTKKQFMKSINLIIAFFSGIVVFTLGNLPILLLIGIIIFVIVLIHRWIKKIKEPK